MKNVYPQLFKSFQCLKGACPDSCCKGWEVDVDNATLNLYSEISGGIKQRIDSVLTYDEFGNNVFRLTQEKRCPFLNSDDLCDIHIELGVGYTPMTCRNFPKFINNYGALTETGFSFSCPVAAGLMWDKADAFEFCEETTAEQPHFNSIDAQLFYELKGARQQAFELVKDPGIDIKEKACRLLNFGAEIQNDIKKSHSRPRKISLSAVFKNPEIINSAWLEKLDAPNTLAVRLPGIAGENILTYFVYRYFLNAVYDRQVLPRLRLAVLGLLIPALFGNDPRTMQLWSKETEHSDVNMKELRKNLKIADSLREPALLELVYKMLL
ncbi:MAG: flagellin lysine-N-methylase [Clostridiales bacterium]|nr:flagellin lysine-N-methylase [Clostridiales bacterium]